MPVENANGVRGLLLRRRRKKKKSLGFAVAQTIAVYVANHALQTMSTGTNSI
jgi:hypothetical protein